MEREGEKNCANECWPKPSRHTVDGNSNALREVVAISTDKGRDLSESVDLEKLGGLLVSVGRDNLEIEAVGLRNSEDGRRAGVPLQRERRQCISMTR